MGSGLLAGGGIAARGHLCGYQLDPCCEVVALWDPDMAWVREQAQRLGATSATLCTSMEELLSQPDIQACWSVRPIIYTGNMPMLRFRPENMCSVKSR